MSGLTALKARRNVGRVQPGQAVLINGDSGGVGVYAVQIATALGGRVTGVCGPTNVELVRSPPGQVVRVRPGVDGPPLVAVRGAIDGVDDLAAPHAPE